jgi:hypothetical protein
LAWAEFRARQEKHRQAYEFVKRALSNEFGEEMSQRVIGAAGLTNTKSITVAGLRRLETELNREQDELQALLSDLPPVFLFTDAENEEISRFASEDLKIGRIEEGIGALDPQFEKDADRIGTYLISEKGVTDLCEQLLELENSKRVDLARRSMREHVKTGNDSPLTVIRKAFQLSKLISQKALAPTFLKICATYLKGGLPMGEDSDYKYILEKKEIDGQLYQVIHVSLMLYVTNIAIEDKRIPLRQGSLLGVQQELRVKDEDLAKLADPPVEVVSTRGFQQLELDRSPAPSSNP